MFQTRLNITGMSILSETCGKHIHGACKGRNPNSRFTHHTKFSATTNNMDVFKPVEIVRLPILSIFRWTR